MSQGDRLQMNTQPCMHTVEDSIQHIDVRQVKAHRSKLQLPRVQLLPSTASLVSFAPDLSRQLILQSWEDLSTHTHRV